MCQKEWTRVVVEGMEGGGGEGSMGILDLAPAGCGGRVAGSSPVGLVMLSYGGACGREIGLCKLPENFWSSFFSFSFLVVFTLFYFFYPSLFKFSTDAHICMICMAEKSTVHRMGLLEYEINRKLTVFFPFSCPFISAFFKQFAEKKRKKTLRG